MPLPSRLQVGLFLHTLFVAEDQEAEAAEVAKAATAAAAAAAAEAEPGASESAQGAIEGEQPRSPLSPRPRAPMTTTAALRSLLHSRVYVYSVAALSALFFVVTGIQFWVTSYLVDVLGAPKETVVGAFAVVSITAPVAGVAVGATIVDRLGGYQGLRGVARTLKVCAAFAAVAAAAALSTCFVNAHDGAFMLVVGLISVTLFFGGSLIAC